LTACAASTDGRPAADEPRVAFDLNRGWRLNPAVSVRPESFGALIYHFGNRRLSFLKTQQMVTVVRLLESHESAAGALAAAGVPAGQRARYAAALAALADSEVIDAR
jgi:mycofactocin biosynthesis protein MftB